MKIGGLESMMAMLVYSRPVMYRWTSENGLLLTSVIALTQWRMLHRTGVRIKDF